MLQSNVNSDDYYAVLGLESSADVKAIKKAYHKLARMYHPDRGVGGGVSAPPSPSHDNPQQSPRRELLPIGESSGASAGADAEEDPLAGFGYDSSSSNNHGGNSRLSRTTTNRCSKTGAKRPPRRSILYMGRSMPADAFAAKLEAKLNKFAVVSKAYAVLSDPTQRATYDVLHGHRQNSHEEFRRVVEMRRVDAEKAVALMEVTYSLVRRAELAKGGMVIDRALFGALQPGDTALAAAGFAGELPQSGPVVDVTKPVQCLVKGSRLLIPSGNPKSHLTGFYDPCANSCGPPRLSQL